MLSDLGYGRRTLTRVTAHAACCKVGIGSCLFSFLLIFSFGFLLFPFCYGSTLVFSRSVCRSVGQSLISIFLSFCSNLLPSLEPGYPIARPPACRAIPSLLPCSFPFCLHPSLSLPIFLPPLSPFRHLPPSSLPLSLPFSPPISLLHFLPFSLPSYFLPVVILLDLPLPRSFPHQALRNIRKSDFSCYVYPFFFF